MKLRARAAAIVALGLTVIALSLSGGAFSFQRAGDTGASAVTQTQNKTPQQQAAEAFYHRVWALTSDNFLWQNRMTDWAKWEHKFDGNLNSQADAERAINQLLDTLNDPYTYFKDASLTSSRGQAAQATNVVTHKMLANDVGYIRIRTFGSVNTADELEAALKALSNAKAFVLDLRDNGGGYVWQSFRSFALLGGNGVFTTLRGRSQGKPYLETLEVTVTELVQTIDTSETRSARPDDLVGGRPIVVLVNGDSASASEMLTGALRDSLGAKVVGTLSFGKGIAQNTWTLDGGTSVQITFAQYYFPSGVNIHKTGIKPDVEVKPSLIGDAQLDSAAQLAKDAIGK